MKYKHSNRLLAACLIAAGSVFALSAQAGLIFTYEDPGVQETTVPDVITETFNTGSPSTLIGTYTNATVIPADIFGGAHETDYYTLLNSGSLVTRLDLNSEQRYFGMWWTAGDDNDLVTFYDGPSLLGAFTIGDIIPLLSPAYYGNPNPSFLGAVPAQPFVYLNFTTTGDSVITSIEFTQALRNGDGGFETDNHSVFDQVITPPGNSIPDTGFTFALLGMSLGAMGLARRKIRK